jgi:hypothetical protein
MKSAHAAEPQKIVHVFLVQESEKPSNRDDAEEIMVPVYDGDVRVMAFNGSQRYSFGILIRPHFDWRGPSKSRQRHGLVRHDQALNRHLADESMLTVHKINMTEFFPRSLAKRR